MQTQDYLSKSELLKFCRQVFPAGRWRTDANQVIASKTMLAITVITNHDTGRYTLALSYRGAVIARFSSRFQAGDRGFRDALISTKEFLENMADDLTAMLGGA